MRQLTTARRSRCWLRCGSRETRNPLERRVGGLDEAVVEGGAKDELKAADVEVAEADVVDGLEQVAQLLDVGLVQLRQL